MIEDVQLSERAQQVARVMLRLRHDNGDYVYLSLSELTDKTGLSRGTVAQIVGRLRNFGWLEDFRERGGGDRLSRFTADGSARAQEMLDRYGPEPVSGVQAGGGKPVTLAYLEEAVRDGRENPGVLAAVRRALGWG